MSKPSWAIEVTEVLYADALKAYDSGTPNDIRYVCSYCEDGDFGFLNREEATPLSGCMFYSDCHYFFFRDIAPSWADTVDRVSYAEAKAAKAAGDDSVFYVMKCSNGELYSDYYHPDNVHYPIEQCSFDFGLTYFFFRKREEKNDKPEWANTVDEVSHAEAKRLYSADSGHDVYYVAGYKHGWDEVHTQLYKCFFYPNFKYFFFRYRKEHAEVIENDSVETLNKQITKLRTELGKSARRLAATRKRLKDAGIVAPQPKKQVKVNHTWSFSVSPESKRPEIDYLEILAEIRRTKAKFATLLINSPFGQVNLKVEPTSTVSGRVWIYNNFVNDWVDYMSVNGLVNSKYVDFNFGNTFSAVVELHF